MMKRSNKKITTEEFIEKSKKSHGDKYDYSLVEYINAHTKVKIICLEHGAFEQTPSNHNHVNKYGCSMCANNVKMTTKEFIEKAKIIHNKQYDYSLVNYIDSHTKVKIICLEHGEFLQMPTNHLSLNGCPSCNSSKGEMIVEQILKKYKLEFEKQYSFQNCKNINKLYFDFYLKSKNLLIEYDGEQHFKPIKRFGGEKKFLKTKKLDQIKNEYAKSNNIKLIRIPYTKFNQIEEILNNEIKF